MSSSATGITSKRKGRTLSCPTSLDNFKRELLCRSNISMDHKKNIHNLSVPVVPSGGSDPDAVTQGSGQVNGLGSHAESLRSTPSEPSPSPPWNTESFARRRASSVHLPPLNTRRLDSHDSGAMNNGAGAAAAEPVVDENVVEEVADEAIEHFTGFLVQELDRNGLPQPADLQEDIQSARVQHTSSQTQTDLLIPVNLNPSPPTATPTGYKHPQWAKRGKGLRRLADDFAQTRERDKVRLKASGVNSDSITSQEFRDMLSELFPNNVITRERIVVLFFFCTDLAILALQQDHIELFHRLVRWTLDYLKGKICMWVASQGGWGAVLSTSVDYIYRGAQIVGAGVLLYVAYKLLTNATTNTSSK